MEIRFANSTDGTKIAYDVTGKGSAVLLLHGGFIQSRRNWHDAGYIERLGSEFTAVAIDIRGHGESESPEGAEAYSPERVIDDLHSAANDCGIDRFALWGYSLGGTIALQAAAKSERITGAIISGSWFGPIFTDEMVKPFLNRGEAVLKAKSEGRLEELSLSPQERDFFDNVNLPVVLDFYRALSKYPSIEPSALLCPALVMAGSANSMTAAKLKEREEEILASGIILQIIEGLNHAQELSEIEIVLPSVLSFLRQIED